MEPKALTTALLLTALLGSGQQPRGPAGTIGPALQAALDGSLPNSGAIGVSAAAVFPDGSLWAGATGLSHEGVPLATDMLFDIASAAKNLQAALALTLVEKGAIALDDPLDKWLPPSPRISGRITVRQLLNLTSGINDFVGDPRSPFRVGFVNIDFEKVWTWEEIQDVFIHEPSFEPGTRCEYSSTNYIVLKQVIERATRSKQTALLADLLLGPNHLDHTVADLSRPLPKTMPVAHAWFDTDGDGSPEDITGRSLSWVVSLAPMVVYSTPSDMARWTHALYHEKTVLREETLKAMLDFVGPVEGEPLMKGYGLGVVDINVGAMLPRWQRVRSYGHLGNQFGYMTFVGYFPDFGVSLAVMSNRGCDRDSERAIVTVGGAVIDALLRRLGAQES